MHNILLSFVGNQDPAGKSGNGPILSLLEHRRNFFTKAVLFYIPATVDNADATSAAIAGCDKNIEVQLCALEELNDPTCHEMILKCLRPALAKYCPVDHTARYFVAIASGTPAMHACWFMLSAAGEMVGTLLHIIEKRFASDQKTLIREIDPFARVFPVVRPYAGLSVLSTAIDANRYRAALTKAGILGNSATLHHALQKAANAAATTTTILIRGATGTGKELVANFLHFLSPRAEKSLLKFNCSTFTENMIESGLFGHTRGAFTGAISKRLGCFKLADGGTLFLDEIGDMSLSAQTKILRAVEYKEIIPVGCDKPETVDVRLICATHQDLSRLISDGRFREDLYYRIGIIELYLPSLDERREDIPVLAKHFLERLNAAYKKQCRLSADGHDYLLNRNWPGNVRELQGLMERSVIYAGRDIITADDLYDNAGRSLEDNPSFLPELGNGFHLKNYMDHINRQLYKKALAQTNNNQSRAAELLGVSPQSVSQFIQKNKNR